MNGRAGPWGPFVRRLSRCAAGSSANGRPHQGGHQGQDPARDPAHRQAEGRARSASDPSTTRSPSPEACYAHEDRRKGAGHDGRAHPIPRRQKRCAHARTAKMTHPQEPWATCSRSPTNQVRTGEAINANRVSQWSRLRPRQLFITICRNHPFCWSIQDQPLIADY